ncbi:protein kinase [Cronbergia sp. UHCC 0137]|uniref:protein kinase domain-containing protein n=1 Tax=Cronbergia sp. UHCC 0137 TaxID=3110239 RepID=UPI002B20D546|nr:protein kinase [Cronbergia sp. UHCC 0137]MEA5621143.1 protein kinase [Cronbergia sp. UHCC 0137]
MTTKLLNNRYQVIKVLGAGGFGETFLAEDTHLPSRRRCVIKQLKPIINDPKTYQLIQQRFEREAATLEKLGESSDQIPKLHAYFPENGQFYLVQEWIEGKTLTEILESQQKISENTVRQILVSLLSVLDYIHSKGIIHRDIKPDNIIIRSQDQKPVLIDFGAVKETIRTVVNTSGNATKSIVIGTPGYMPIEQGIGRPVYATDIYSLGLTAIYLLTGKHPHELESNPQTGQILWEEYASGVSPQLVMILTQAIEPRTSDRYTTASKMLYALESGSSVSPVSSATKPPLVTSQRTQAVFSPDKNPVIPQPNNSPIWQNPVVIFASLLIGVVGTVILASSIKPQPQPTEAIANNTNITPQPQISTTLTPSSPVLEPPVTPPTQQQIIPNPVPATEPTPEAVIEETPIPPVAITPEPIPESTADPTPIVPTIEPTPEESEQEVPQNKQKVPAFPTGTPRSSVEAVLGKPKRDLRGLWGNTRAVTYKVVPNQIDLGYLFDRNSGVLQQTEAAFAETVDPQVMQTTLNGMLNGQATSEIIQGLQKVQQRQKDNFKFTHRGVKGQIIRQECDFIYISIWDANLHDFVNPKAAKQC